MRSLLKELLIDEIQQCFSELETLLENHIAWVDRLHELLVCGGRVDPADVAEDAHQRCPFGHWFHADNSSPLRTYPDFLLIGETHERMHRQARKLLLSFQQGVPVERTEYQKFTRRLAELRAAIRRLHAQLKNDLTALSRLTARVFENAAEGVIITSADGIILSVNKAFTEVTGFTQEEAVGRSPHIIKSGRHDREFYERMWESLRTKGSWQGEIWNRRKNGEVYPEWLSISVVREDAGHVSHYVAMFSDITVAKRNEERLNRLAHYDPLTGLPNRTLFEERLAQSLAIGKRQGWLSALLFLDLDRFKQINDTLGHKAGDELLVQVAKRILACIRHSDTAARLAGDEFVVILNNIDGPEGARGVARKIVEGLRRPFQVLGQEILVTTSIGVSLAPLHGEDLEVLIRAADLAMYEAKEQGRDNYKVYRRAAHARVSESFEMELNLRAAIERDELRLYYQPQIEIETGRVVGMEALLRWEHPQNGLIFPGQFLPVAEETGLIKPIGEWVLRTACRQNRLWQESGINPFRVAVNISHCQLRHQDLAERVAEALDDSGLDAEWLKLELTESSVTHNSDEVIGMLRQLKSMGVFLSIDDFGSGYSGLTYLKRFPIDTIKIDKSFISGIVDNSDDQAIAKAIIALAQALNLQVVAEGVEREEQLFFLREHECCDAQGYYFSKPLPATIATKLLRERNRFIIPR